jgi:uncharacterized membrane protein
MNLRKDPASIRDTLREGSSISLDNRRKIIFLAAMGLCDFALISLYQSGVIKKLPDLPLPYFDSNEVNASKKAYASGLPDGTSGALMYAVTMMLASYGGDRNSGREKIWDRLLMGAAAIGSVAGLQYLYDMAFKQKKICMYCVGGAFLNLSMHSYAWNELKENHSGNHLS